MTGVHLGMPAFPAFPGAAREAVRDEVLRANLRHATHTIRDKRARAVAELADWDGCAPRARPSRTTRCAISTTTCCSWRRR